MTRHEPSPSEAETRRDLEAIDNALAGAEVGAGGAAMADLTRALVSLRAKPTPEFARALDARAAAGFGRARSGRPGTVGGQIAALAAAVPARLRGATLRPAAGLAVVAIVAVVVVAASPFGSHH